MVRLVWLLQVNKIVLRIFTWGEPKLVLSSPISVTLLLINIPSQNERDFPWKSHHSIEQPIAKYSSMVSLCKLTHIKDAQIWRWLFNPETSYLWKYWDIEVDHTSGGLRGGYENWFRTRKGNSIFDQWKIQVCEALPLGTLRCCQYIFMKGWHVNLRTKSHT